MFKVTDNPTFTHEVKVMVPADGGHREESLKATYRVLPIDEMRKFALDTPQGGTEFLRAVILKLDDLVGEDKKPITYNDDVRDRVLALPYCRAALAQGYFDAVSSAKAGN